MRLLQLSKLHRRCTRLILGVFIASVVTQYCGPVVFAVDAGTWSPQTNGIGDSYMEKMNNSEFFEHCGPASSADSKSTASTELGNVYMLGDSITLGAQQSGIEDKFKQAGASEVTISASGGGNLKSAGTTGTMKSGFDAIESDKDTIRKANTIIIAHGTNQVSNDVGDPSNSSAYVENSKATIKEAIDKVKATGTTGKILWVDVAISSAAGGSYPSFVHLIDKAIYEGTSNGYTIISWAKKVDPGYDPANASGPVGDPNHYLADGIHPSTDGYSVYMDTIVNGAKSGGTSGSSSDSSGTSTSTGGSNTPSTTSNGGTDTASSSTDSGSTGGGDLQKIADEAVEKGKADGINVAVKVSGDKSASAGESGQMPSASVIKLLIAAALSQKAVPLDSVKSDLDIMISNSDNDAANRLIDKAGGFGDINATADKLGIGSDIHIGRKLAEAVAGADPNTISATGSDTLLNEFKKSADGSGGISKDYASAVIDAMKKQTINTKWGAPATGIPHENIAHKTGELGGAQHDVGFFIKGDKWLTVTTMTNNPAGDEAKGVALVQETAKKLYEAWGPEDEKAKSSDTCCADGGSSDSGSSGGGSGEPLPASVPEPWRTLINDAAAKHPDSDRRIVAATLWAENRGWPEYKESSSTTSESAAVGFWQFIPSTWASLGEDGDGDGIKDPKNPKDAVHAAFKHSPGSAGKPIIYEGTGNAQEDYESKKFYRQDESKYSLLTYMANYNGNDGSAIEGSTLPNFRRAQNGDYVRMGYWLMATNFEKGWLPESDKMVDAAAQGPGAKGGSAGVLSSDSGKGSCGSEKKDDSSAFGKGIVEAAKEMMTWGQKYQACYLWGGGHSSKEDLERRIDAHFAGPENGVDCSGFTAAAILKGTGQLVIGSTDALCASDKFEHVPIAEAKPGDLSIGCSTHVAVIIEVNGNGNFKTAESMQTGCGPGKGASPGNYKGTENFVLRLKG